MSSTDYLKEQGIFVEISVENFFGEILKTKCLIGLFQPVEGSVAGEYLHSVPLACPKFYLEMVVEQQEWGKIGTQTSIAETFQKCDIFRISRM